MISKCNFSRPLRARLWGRLINPAFFKQSAYWTVWHRFLAPIPCTNPVMIHIVVFIFFKLMFYIILYIYLFINLKCLYLCYCGGVPSLRFISSSRPLCSITGKLSYEFTILLWIIWPIHVFHSMYLVFHHRTDDVETSKCQVLHFQFVNVIMLRWSSSWSLFVKYTCLIHELELIFWSNFKECFLTLHKLHHCVKSICVSHSEMRTSGFPPNDLNSTFAFFCIWLSSQSIYRVT